jgi:hypothetical protein
MNDDRNKLHWKKTSALKYYFKIVGGICLEGEQPKYMCQNTLKNTNSLGNNKRACEKLISIYT